MTTTNELTQRSIEYTIHVDGLGYASGCEAPPFYTHVGTGEPAVFTDEESVNYRARSIADDYRRLGMPDIADKVHIRVRTVTTTRDEWFTPQPQPDVNTYHFNITAGQTA